MRVISDELWQKTQKRWEDIEKAFPKDKGRPGFSKNQKGRAKTHPQHLFSGALKCGRCNVSSVVREADITAV